MANTEIDSLSLQISINGLSDRDVKNLESLSNSIAKLQRNLRKLELSKLQDIKIPSNLKGLTGVEYNITPIKNELIDNIGEYDEAFSNVEETFTRFSDTVNEETKKINTNVSKIKTSAKDLGEESTKALDEKKPKKVNKQLGQIEKTLKRIKTISFIKLIRGAINYIIRGFQEGVKNLALFDKEFNKTMSALNTAKTNSFNSLALILEPIITSITPLVQQLSTNLTSVANSISQISASMKGLTSYTKINSKYAEDYAKSMQSANKFSFDTFESIDLSSSMFETETVNEEEVNRAGDLAEFFSIMKETLFEIRSIVLEVMNKVSPMISKVLPLINTIATQTLQVIEDIGDFVVEIVSVLEPLLDVLINDVGSTLTSFMGVLIENVGALLEVLTPLIKSVVGNLLPAIIKLANTLISPIFKILEAILPIIVEVASIVADILTPVVDLIAEILEYINILLEPIVDIIEWLVSGIGEGIVGALKIVHTLLKPLITAIQVIAEFVGYIVDAVEALFNLDFNGFKDNMIKAFKGILSGILKILASIVDSIINAFIGLINRIIANDVIKSIVSFFGGNWEGITWKSNLADSVPSFANGGLVGEVWQMNEYGNAEMLFNSNGNSNTAVITQEQLTNAFENAIFNTGLLDTIRESSGVYLDGKSIAQSESFKKELNRTNPKLQIR